jgi:hypothetical protein
MELKGWTSPQMVRLYGASAPAAPAPAASMAASWTPEAITG